MSGVKRNMAKAYGLVWGQCSAALQAHLKDIEDYLEKSDELNLIWLLGELKKAIAGIDPKSNDVMTLHDEMSFLYNTKQGRNEVLHRWQSLNALPERNRNFYIAKQTWSLQRTEPRLVYCYGTQTAGDTLVFWRNSPKELIYLETSILSPFLPCLNSCANNPRMRR